MYILEAGGKKVMMHEILADAEVVRRVVHAVMSVATVTWDRDGDV